MLHIKGRQSRKAESKQNDVTPSEVEESLTKRRSPLVSCGLFGIEMLRQAQHDNDYGVIYHTTILKIEMEPHPAFAQDDHYLIQKNHDRGTA